MDRNSRSDQFEVDSEKEKDRKQILSLVGSDQSYFGRMKLNGHVVERLRVVIGREQFFIGNSRLESRSD